MVVMATIGYTWYAYFIDLHNVWNKVLYYLL